MQHQIFEKSKGYKNKIMAQNVGIAIAKGDFDMFFQKENRGFAFDWHTYYGHINRAEKNLFMYFKDNIKNMQELQAIAKEAAKIEWNNLLEENKDNLPVDQFSDSEIVSKTISLATDSVVKLSQVNFYAELSNQYQINVDDIWKEEYLKKYKIQDLIEMSHKKAIEIFNLKNVSENNQRDIKIGILEFYINNHSVKDLLF